MTVPACQQISHNSKGQRGTLSPEHLEIDHLPVQGSGYGGLDLDLTHGQVPPWWIWDSLLLVDCLHTLGVGEDALADTQVLRSYFQQLVLTDELHALLQAHTLVGSQTQGVIRTGRTHIGNMLLLADIDCHILTLGRITHNHALVNRNTGPDEEHTALLGIVEAIGNRLTGFKGDERTHMTGGNITLVG